MSWSTRTTKLLPGSALLLVLATAALPLTARAQSRELSLSAGGMSFDASGTGTAPTAAVRVALPLVGRWSLVEGSLGYAMLGEQFTADPTRVGIAEAQLQLQLPLGAARPYVGVGGGWVRYMNNVAGRSTMPGTLSGAAGLRLRVSPRVGLRGEFRVRGWERTSAGGFGFVNSAAEFTGGLSYAF